MHFFVFIPGTGEAKTNYLWLPGFIFVDEKLQLIVGAKVKQKFLDKHGRPPADTDEDFDELDEMALDALEPYVPFEGWREYIEGMKKVKPLGHKGKECLRRLEEDKMKLGNLKGETR
jgi:hypothetical protein